MSRYLLLLPAPEAEWAELPESALEKGVASHGQFHQDLRAACERFAARGELIEFRRLATD